MANELFIISTRKIEDGVFKDEPGPTRFLKVPASSTAYKESHEIKTPQRWLANLVAAASHAPDPILGTLGDVLVFVHGYNNTMADIIARTSMLRDGLRKQGWNGVVVAFDWPSANSTLNYLEDRQDAAAVSTRLVTEVLPLLVSAQSSRDPDGRPSCRINVHLLGHSTGAFLIMEGLSTADKIGDNFRSDYRFGQVVFIGGDVSSSSLDANSDWGKPLFRRIDRLTNYSNGYDAVLAVSNAKRLGVAPRSGRRGLSASAHPKAVNVDCSAYFETIDPETRKRVGTFCHSWHIGDSVWTADLAMTLSGHIDRDTIPTREVFNGGLRLKPEGGARPKYEHLWYVEGA